MLIGQALKEVFKETRPTKPAIPLQTKWNNEFSLPSTHCMGSLSIATSIVYFTIDRYFTIVELLIKLKSLSINQNVVLDMI